MPFNWLSVDEVDASPLLATHARTIPVESINGPEVIAFRNLLKQTFALTLTLIIMHIFAERKIMHMLA